MMDGQIDMFSYLKSQEHSSEPPKLLKEGQTVFLVVKGDVEQYIVLDETWTCDNNNRGYRLQCPSRSTYNCTWNEEIGKSCFMELDAARNVAEAYLSGKDVIRAETINPIKTVAYSYIRECDGRKMIAFYSELDNGMLYTKEFITFHHMVGKSKIEQAIKRFEEQQEFKHCDIKQIDYVPVFKNMYRIRQECDWDYAEAGHSYAVG